MRIGQRASRHGWSRVYPRKYFSKSIPPRILIPILGKASAHSPFHTLSNSFSASTMGSDFVTAELDSLLAQLTTDEARRLTTGVGWWRTAGIDRLGIPALKVSDGPNGVKGILICYL